METGGLDPQETEQQGAIGGNRPGSLLLPLLLPSFWVYIVIGVPFVILGVWGGFGESFRTGAASAFMCGAIAAAFGEAGIEWARTKIPAFMLPGSREAVAKSDGSRSPVVVWYTLTAILLALWFFAWNMYFAVADKRIRHLTIDWIQITVFIAAAFYAANVRWPLHLLRR
jgi:hypothetical protein